MTLNDIIQAAQGGQGVNNLANQFGLTPEQTQAAIQAMMPAFSMALQRSRRRPAGLGGTSRRLTERRTSGPIHDPVRRRARRGAGRGALGQIFGSPQGDRQARPAVSQMPPASARRSISAMMPVVASMLMGGLSHSLSGRRDFGGVFSELAGAANCPGRTGLGPRRRRPAAPAAGGFAHELDLRRHRASRPTRRRRPRQPGWHRSAACSRPASRLAERISRV